MTLNNRYDFVLLFDVKDGNPNGDPDAGNLPRLDAESGHGLVTDVSLKRKVRNFVGLVKGETPPYDIYVKEKAVLVQAHEKAYIAIGAEDALKGEDKKRKGSGETVDLARKWMCQNFFDVRTFGAVMSLGVNCGQVRGPVQLTFARSIAPVVALEHSITRMAVATEAEAEKQQGDNRTMGRKHTVPYGLYMAHGFVSSFLAKQTGFGEEDLELLWQALEQMFEHDRSAARGEMATRGLYVFKHDSELGNARAHQLFERIQAAPKVEIPRSFNDYAVTIDEAEMPAGVTLIRRVG
ncbi:type I-C CRISPR-associated protein Cas7/Csd2 [Zoogloea sp. 1C4]|uniref:type I-C CRISPR-associated protein Cas7/Csd2 n=1 Tax=Zoogloea sp. 1C4 TaxID=2570190 RepID=UPI001290C808|nr:type I-C CRISPR-associated protein Cas7/Csd2 [Zoogloea sp. 1C4]